MNIFTHARAHAMHTHIATTVWYPRHPGEVIGAMERHFGDYQAHMHTKQSRQ